EQQVRCGSRDRDPVMKPLIGSVDGDCDGDRETAALPGTNGDILRLANNDRALRGEAAREEKQRGERAELGKSGRHSEGTTAGVSKSAIGFSQNKSAPPG